MKFKVVVTEILRREVEIDAPSIGDAYDKVDSMISDCEIVLDADDFVDRDIKVSHFFDPHLRKNTGN